MKNSPQNVSAYIKTAPEETRAKLKQLRRIIKATSPKAKETISYKMPYYNYYGALIWFAAFKNHVGVFLRPPVIAEHKKELKGYETTKSAVHLPLDRPLPVALIRKLIKARMVKNESMK